MATATLAEMGMPTAMERGLRRWGHPFLLMCQEAVVVMEQATKPSGIDPVSGHERTRHNPRDVLPRIIFDALERAEGHGVTVVDARPLGDTKAGKRFGPREELAGILHEFLDAVSHARWTGQDLTIDSRMTVSQHALEGAMDRIQLLFDKELPSGWRKPDAERFALAERVHVLTAQLAAAVGHGTERPLDVEIGFPREVSG